MNRQNYNPFGDNKEYIRALESYINRLEKAFDNSCYYLEQGVNKGKKMSKDEWKEESFSGI